MRPHIPARLTALGRRSLALFALVLTLVLYPRQGLCAGRVLVLRHADPHSRQAEGAIVAYLNGFEGLAHIDVETAPAFESDLAHARRLASEAGVKAVIWTETSTDHTRVCFFRVRDSRTFARNVVGSGATRLDQLAIVARAGVLALMEDADPADASAVVDQAGVEAARKVEISKDPDQQRSPQAQQGAPQEAPAAPLTAKALADAPPDLPGHDRWRLTLGYAGASPTHTWQWRSGVAAGASACPWAVLCIALGYTFAPDDEVLVGEARARLAHHPFELAIELRKTSHALTFFLQTGVAADITSRTTLEVPASLVATPATSQTQFGVLAAGGMEWRFARALALRCTLGADAALTAVRYDTENGPSAATHWVRPRVSLGLAVRLW